MTGGELLETASEAAPEATRPLLSFRDVEISFRGDRGIVRPVGRATFDVRRGGTLALVGESGCGKTLSALATLGLLPPPGEVSAGRIVFDGIDLTTLDEDALRGIRGRRIGMAFQESGGALNPVTTVGAQIAETLRACCGLTHREAMRESIEWLRRVEIPDAKSRARHYPHQLSGGMRQRVMLAIALAGGPELLIADEPTTALDVTTRIDIVRLLERLIAELGMSLLLISHDLGLAAMLAQDIAVMYAGEVVERGPARAVLESPSHPYTAALLESVPRSVGVRRGRSARLSVIPGRVPNPLAFPAGCRFHPRCARVVDRCLTEPPALTGTEPSRDVACHVVESDAAGRDGAETKR